MICHAGQHVHKSQHERVVQRYQQLCDTAWECHQQVKENDREGWKNGNVKYLEWSLLLLLYKSLDTWWFYDWFVCFYKIYYGTDHTKYPFYLTDENKLINNSTKRNKIQGQNRQRKKCYGLYVTKCLNILYFLTMLLQLFSYDKNE